MGAQIFRLFAVIFAGACISAWAAPAGAGEERIQFRAANLDWYTQASKEINELQQQGTARNSG